MSLVVTFLLFSSMVLDPLDHTKPEGMKIQEINVRLEIPVVDVHLLHGEHYAHCVWAAVH